MTYRTRIVAAQDALNDYTLVAAWDRLLAASCNPECLYQSRQWIGNLIQRLPADSLQVAVVNDSDGQIAGVVPFRIQDVRLDFDVAGRSLARPRFQVANILGSRAMLPSSQSAHEALYEGIQAGCPAVGGLYFTSMPMESEASTSLQRYTAGRWLHHPVDGVQLHHFIQLPDSFEKFLEPLKSRTRRNFKRRLKGFDPAEKAGSRSDRIDRADQVRSFLDSAAEISRKTWQHETIGQRVKTDDAECARLSHLAELGILRCYLLYYGEMACAFCIGYQFGEVYYADEIGFDPSLSDVSPGTVLFLKIIQDLTVHRPARIFNFGTGDAPYKHLFSNNTYLDATLLVVPSTLRNRIVIAAHAKLLQLRQRLRDKATAQAQPPREDGGDN
jgi:CelD/BcsL family acetyltransferase involved in cellulose biosynthesis